MRKRSDHLLRQPRTGAKTYESNFIHHNFVQFGKHSRYKAVLSSTVLSQQCCVAGYTSSLLQWRNRCDLTTKCYWNRPPSYPYWLEPPQDATVSRAVDASPKFWEGRNILTLSEQQFWFETLLLEVNILQTLVRMRRVPWNQFLH